MPRQGLQGTSKRKRTQTTKKRIPKKSRLEKEVNRLKKQVRTLSKTRRRTQRKRPGKVLLSHSPSTLSPTIFTPRPRVYFLPSPPTTSSLPFSPLSILSSSIRPSLSPPSPPPPPPADKYQPCSDRPCKKGMHCMHGICVTEEEVKAAFEADMDGRRPRRSKRRR